MNPIRILLFALALALPAVAGAQEIPPGLANSTPQERAMAQTLVMKEKLGLSSEQVPKVEAINLDTAQKVEPVLKGNERPLIKLRTIKQAEQERDTALQKVLTPQQ